MNRENAALALSTVAIVPTIFSASLPPLSVVHGTPSDDPSTAAACRSAVLTATVVVVGLAVAAGSPTVAVAGLTAVAGFAFLYGQARQA